MEELTLDQQRAIAVAKARLRLQAKPSAAEQIENDPITKGAKETFTPAELIAGSAPARFALGAAAPVIGATQLLANLAGAGNVPNDQLRQLEALKQRGMKAYDQEGFDVAGLAGNVLSPVGLAAASRIPAAASYMGKIGTGVAVGGVAGATSPVTSGDFLTEKAIQTGGGAVAGGALSAAAPLVVGAGKAGYRALVEPWANAAAIKGRAFLEAAGDKADEIIALLRQNKEIVPGAAPTAGEAATEAGSTSFSALQKRASGVRGPADDYVARRDAQNAARIAALKTVGQDEPALKKAIEARKAIADPLYEASRKAGDVVNVKPIMVEISTLLKRNPGNRALVTELTNIKNGLTADKRGTLRTNAEEIMSVVDDIKAAMAKEDNKFISSQLDSLKTKISNAIPGYEAADTAFKTASRPVNQIQVGQYLEKKLVPALSDEAKQKAGTFAAAVQDAAGTIKRGTEARYKKLEDVLDPQQLQAVQSVQDDLARGARFDELARAGAKGGPTAIDVGTQSMEQGFGGKVPNLLSRTAMVTNAIITRLEGKINSKLAAEIAAEMLNPPAVAESMKQAQVRATRNAIIAQQVAKMRIPALSGTIQSTSRETQ